MLFCRKRFMLITTLIVALLVAAFFLFMRRAVFGADPATTRLERILTSPNYKNGSFQNRELTNVMAKDASNMGLLRDYWNRSPDNEPKQPLPSVKTDLRALPGPHRRTGGTADSLPTLIWFGHSAYLIKHKGFTVLMDPVFSGSASPVSLFGKAFPGADVYGPNDMPDIDLLVLSHDHYDHLDYLTISQLIPKVKRFVVSLGVGAHLERWGVSADKITELDWWEDTNLPSNVKITATPARHFSGRSFARGRTLWSSFVLDLPGYRIFLGGDSGYDKTFKELGEKFGPFDLAILECGQYNTMWPTIHMFPEEVVTAGQDLRAKAVLPVHWGKFALAYHSWTEPVERFTKQANEVGFPYTTPRIGEPVVIGGTLPKTAWWK